MKEFLELELKGPYVDEGPQRTRVERFGLVRNIQIPGGVIGFIESDTTLHCETGRFHLRAGMYFAGRANFSLGGGNGLLFLMEDYVPQFQIGGPIEDRGRLRYIDGCTDSLLGSTN